MSQGLPLDETCTTLRRGSCRRRRRFSHVMVNRECSAKFAADEAKKVEVAAASKLRLVRH